MPLKLLVAIASTLLAFRSFPITLTVRLACAELDVELTGCVDLREVARRVAVASVRRHRWADEYERAATRGLARALEAGDLARAEQCALWLTEPDRAMDLALMTLSVTPRWRACPHCGQLTADEHRDDRDGACNVCHAERCEVIDAAAPWSRVWEMTDAIDAAEVA